MTYNVSLHLPSFAKTVWEVICVTHKLQIAVGKRWIRNSIFENFLGRHTPRLPKRLAPLALDSLPPSPVFPLCYGTGSLSKSRAYVR